MFPDNSLLRYLWPTVFILPGPISFPCSKSFGADGLEVHWSYETEVGADAKFVAIRHEQDTNFLLTIDGYKFRWAARYKMWPGVRRYPALLEYLESKLEKDLTLRIMELSLTASQEKKLRTAADLTLHQVKRQMDLACEVLLQLPDSEKVFGRVQIPEFIGDGLLCDDSFYSKVLHRLEKHASNALGAR